MSAEPGQPATNAAHAWLCEASREYPASADIWNFGRDWGKECNNSADKQKTSLTTSLYQIA